MAPATATATAVPTTAPVSVTPLVSATPAGAAAATKLSACTPAHTNRPAPANFKTPNLVKLETANRNNGKRKRGTDDHVTSASASASVQLLNMQAQVAQLQAKLVEANAANAAAAEREEFVSSLLTTMNTVTVSVIGWKVPMNNIFREVSLSEHTLSKVHWGALKDAIQPRISAKRAEMISHFESKKKIVLATAE